MEGKKGKKKSCFQIWSLVLIIAGIRSMLLLCWLIPNPSANSHGILKKPSTFVLIISKCVIGHYFKEKGGGKNQATRCSSVLFALQTSVRICSVRHRNPSSPWRGWSEAVSHWQCHTGRKGCASLSAGSTITTSVHLPCLIVIIYSLEHG